MPNHMLAVFVELEHWGHSAVCVSHRQHTSAMQPLASHAPSLHLGFLAFTRDIVRPCSQSNVVQRSPCLARSCTLVMAAMVTKKGRRLGCPSSSSSGLLSPVTHICLSLTGLPHKSLTRSWISTFLLGHKGQS